VFGPRSRSATAGETSSPQEYSDGTYVRIDDGRKDVYVRLPVRAGCCAGTRTGRSCRPGGSNHAEVAAWHCGRLFRPFTPSRFPAQPMVCLANSLNPSSAFYSKRRPSCRPATAPPFSAASQLSSPTSRSSSSSSSPPSTSAAVPAARPRRLNPATRIVSFHRPLFLRLQTPLARSSGIGYPTSDRVVAHYPSERRGRGITA
jgi:hypothetical protein